MIVKPATEPFAIVSAEFDGGCTWYHVWTEGEEIFRCGERRLERKEKHDSNQSQDRRD